MQHLLRTFPTEQTITEALNDFEYVYQAENESETAFAARLEKAAYRCGKVHEEN